MTRPIPTRTRCSLTHTRRFLALIAFSLLISSTPSAQPPDTLGTKIWDYDTFYERIECVSAVPDGGYITSGFTYYEDLDFRTWTARLDDDGNDIWILIDDFGSVFTDASYHIEPTSDGAFIECGETWSDTPSFGANAFIRKLSSDGDIIWSHVYDYGSPIEYLTHLREVVAGGYIAAGKIGTQSNIIRFDENGDFVWQWPLPDPFETIHWVEPTADGGFVIPAEHWNSNAQARVYSLYKIDAGGNQLWMNDEVDPDGTPKHGVAFCVREDEQGYLYSCGGVLTDSTHFDFYVSKRNSDGSVIWSQYLDRSGGGDEAVELSILADGTIEAVGHAQDESNNYMLWLVKYSSNGEVLWLSELQMGAEDTKATSMTQGRDGSIVAAYLPEEDNDPLDLALVKWKPEVRVELQPRMSVVPSQGLTLHYQTFVSNILLDPTPLDVWATVTTPAGNTFPLQQISVTLQPGGMFYRPYVPLDIPAAAPPGEYTFELHIGVAPPDDPPGGATGSRHMGLGSFTFEKGTGTSVPDGSDWLPDGTH